MDCACKLPPSDYLIELFAAVYSLEEFKDMLDRREIFGKAADSAIDRFLEIRSWQNRRA